MFLIKVWLLDEKGSENIFVRNFDGVHYADWTCIVLVLFSADNYKKTPRMLPRQDFSVFNQPDDDNRHIMSPQLSVAAFQFLSTCKYAG